MSAQQPQHSKYGFSKTVDVPYEEAVEKARAALKEEGFGVLCEIDIKEKLKEKLGVDFRNYVPDKGPGGSPNGGCIRRGRAARFSRFLIPFLLKKRSFLVCWSFLLFFLGRYAPSS